MDGLESCKNSGVKNLATSRYSYSLCTTALYSTAVIPTPDIPKIKIEVSHMFGVFMLVIPIPDIYTGF